MTTVAEKSRRQRSTPKYKAWRAEYEKSEKYKVRVRAYDKARRADPVKRAKNREYVENYITRNRIAVLARHVIARCKKSGMECDADYLRSFKGQRPAECPCCAVAFDYALSQVKGRPKLNGPSFDRIDTTKGYVPGNVSIICWRCNALKRDARLHELEIIVAYMRRHLCP